MGVILPFQANTSPVARFASLKPYRDMPEISDIAE
jgi:hypothetical protein